MAYMILSGDDLKRFPFEYSKLANYISTCLDYEL